MNIKVLFGEFSVTTEEQLQEKLIKDSLSLPCQFCKKEFSIEKIVFMYGDPCCSPCKKRRKYGK